MRRATALVGVCLAGLLVAGAQAARSTVELTSEGVLEKEVALGDLVADAIREAGQAQVALVNATQFKPGDAVAAGKVTAGDVSALLVKPGRQWVVSQITGECLKAALERSLSRCPSQSAHFLQVSGLKLTYDEKAGAGARITSLTVDGKAVQNATTYRVAMPDDLAKGGSGYFTIPCFSESTIQPDATGTLADAISAFLDAHATLEYGEPDRIVPAK